MAKPLRILILDDAEPDALLVVRYLEKKGFDSLRVYAEGVEDHETLEFLMSCGCDKVQGYLISKPVPGDALIELGSTWNSETMRESAG